MNLKVDFIAEKYNEVIYIQSSLFIQDDDKIEQKVRPLKKISNSFKKIIINKYGDNNFYDKDGILHLNHLIFFLMKTNINQFIINWFILVNSVSNQKPIEKANPIEGTGFIRVRFSFNYFLWKSETM